MPTFSYDAASSAGPVRGIVDAPTRAAAVERILALGRTPTRVAERPPGAAVHDDGAGGVLSRWGVNRDRLELLHDFSVLLHAGLSVERCLVALEGVTRAPAVKTVLRSLLDGLRGGEALSVAMQRAAGFFPDAMRKLVAAGEASGRLPEVMSRIAAAAARNKDLKDRAISALIYPALLVVVMIAVLAMIFTVVLPRLEPLFAQSGAALPWPAAALLAVAHFIDAYGVWLVFLLVAGLAAAIYALRLPDARLWLDRAAIRSRMLFGLPQHYAAAQLCRNLAMLLDGGMPLNRALEAVEGTIGNGYVRDRLSRTSEAVRHGRPLKAAFEQAEVFPPLVVEFAALGEETGKLGALLDEAAAILDDGVRTKLDRLSALLLPVVTVVLGAVVAAIMTGVVSGILSANDLAL